MFSSKTGFSLWLLLHGIIGVLFFFFGNPKVETSLYSILPETHPVKTLAPVEEQIGSQLNSRISILIGHEEFTSAQRAAQELLKSMENQQGIAEIQLLVNPDSLAEMQHYLHENRYRILSPRTAELLSQGKQSAIAERAFMSLISPVTLGALDHLSEDPFLLAQENFQYFLESGITGNTALGLRDSYLTREYQGKHWILMTMKTRNYGSSIELNENPVPIIYEESKKISASIEGIEFVFSGVPFHSYDSAELSQKQITLLSSLSSFFIVLMMLLVFRSIKPLAATSIAILTGMGCGLAVTLLIFKEIHIFTIVFGTSLIGISVDYSFHYFTEWASALKKESIIKKIKPGITTGLITTVLSYSAFTLTSFPLLQQMALFSISGLLSTCASVFLLYPLFGNPSSLTRKHAASASGVLMKLLIKLKKIKKPVRVLLILLSAALCVVGLIQYNMDNNIKGFYKMSPQRQLGEQMSSRILEHGSSGIYLLLEGASLEENLQLEEKIRTELDKYLENEDLSSYMGLSYFLPSKQTQDENLQLVKKQLFGAMKEQLLFLGYGEEEFKQNINSFNNSINQYTSVESLQNLPLNSFTDLLNIGLIGNKYYTTLLLFGIAEQQNLKALADSYPSIYYMNKSEDTSRTLQALSGQAIKIILISYLVILAGLSLRYKFKSAAIIVLIPAAASLLALAILSMTGLSVNLFFVVALILIPGMGTDYLILLMESPKAKPEIILSISMSMLTTVLAFGLLGFTSIASLFGLTVSTGVLISYLISILFLQWKRSEI